MRILYYFKDDKTPMTGWQKFQIFDEMRSHNCEFDIFDFGFFSSLDEANDKLVQYAKNNIQNIDAFMTACSERELYVDTLHQIKKLGIPTFLFCCDNNTVPFNHRHICKYFDVVWLTTKDTEYLFRKWGANTLFMPFAANPNYYAPDFDNEINHLGFIGTPYGTRTNIINCLTSHKIDVTVHCTLNNNINAHNTHNYSNGKYIHLLPEVGRCLRFHNGRVLLYAAIKNRLSRKNILNINATSLHVQPPVTFEEMPTYYSRYSLALSSTFTNSTAVLKHPLNFLVLRCFEIPMSGGLQFVNYSDELASYFKEDEEIIFYRSFEEMVDKSRFYLRSDNRELRRKMKLAARERAIRDHTWFLRFEKLFNMAGIKFV